VVDFITSIQVPAPGWQWAAFSGIAFGLVAFFSVFIFMFKGRTATFTGLLNRLTSLVAGTTATLLGHWLFRSRWPSLQNWVSLGFVLVAVVFLSRAERKRAEELKLAQEI
jgi:drug/metabolite transporter (DMT)-like permease